MTNPLLLIHGAKKCHTTMTLRLPGHGITPLTLLIRILPLNLHPAKRLGNIVSPSLLKAPQKAFFLMYIMMALPNGTFPTEMKLMAWKPTMVILGFTFTAVLMQKERPA